MKTYALITPDDIRSYISTCFTEHREHRTSYCNIIKQWIISRTSDVTVYHCFMLIYTFCSNILPSLTQSEMSVLLLRMKGSVNDCLNYRLLPRTNTPGNRIGWNVGYNYKIRVHDNVVQPVITQSARNNMNPRCIYPRRVETHFDRYEHAIRSDEFQHILIYGDYLAFIDSHYIKGIYFTNQRPSVNLITESTEAVRHHASIQQMNETETIIDSSPIEESKEKTMNETETVVDFNQIEESKEEAKSSSENTETVSHQLPSKKK